MIEYPSEEQLKTMYAEYVEYFDPTPEYLYDLPYRMQEYDEWKEDYLWEIDEKNGLVVTLPTIYNETLTTNDASHRDTTPVASDVC